MSHGAQQRYRAATGFWLSHSGLDWVLVGAVVGGHYALFRTGHLRSLLDGVPADKRPGLYSAAAVVISLTGTLVSVSVAQYLSGRGDRMQLLKGKFSGQLGGIWRSVFRGSLFAAFLFLVAYAADARHPSGTPVHGSTPGAWIFEAGAVLALLRVTRLAALFGHLIDVIVMDQIDESDTDAPEVEQDWLAPGPARRSA